MFLWERYAERGTIPDGSVLPALRRGIGQEPGSVPAMWEYYTCLDKDGHLTRRLWAEHLCLTAFGVHQQGRPYLVHSADGDRFGRALSRLRASETYSEQALDRRVTQLATATQPDEIATHLMSLMRMIRGCSQINAIDYTALFWNLVRLRSEDSAPTVRRQWGSDYRRPTTTKEG